MKYIHSKSCLGFAVAAVMLGCIPAALGESKRDQKAEYEFVIVLKVVHPWFDQANEGAKKATK